MDIECPLCGGRLQLGVKPAPDPHPARLHVTGPQLEVMALYARGLTYGEIAARLCLSRSAVIRRVERALAGIEARTPAQAVAMLIEAGLLRGPSGPDEVGEV